MTISLNEIEQRAIKFVHDWKDETSEKAEAQSFWNDFFNIFDISRRRVATFEKAVEKLNAKKGRIDVYFEKKIIIEHKSEGEDLNAAARQAFDYLQGIEQNKLPHCVVVCDFKRFILIDLDNNNTQYAFALEELPAKIRLFDFMTGREQKDYKEDDPVTPQAAELMGELHDSLKNNGYVGHPLEVLSVRLIYCFFAEHTQIFSNSSFTEYIETRTNADGSDVGSRLNELFGILDQDKPLRQKNLDKELTLFDYINGSLFKEPLPTPSFDSTMRALLLKCCHFDWSKVSPAIFGTIFQAIMEANRRGLGAHYTSEKNIRKTIDSLFLDELKAEFESHKTNINYLIAMRDRISKMKFLDPACGCGTFLVITYRELRRLQMEIHKILHIGTDKVDGKERTTKQMMITAVEDFNADINVDTMYGIELEEFPARIAEVALWLVDHQMNREIAKEFGVSVPRIPLKTASHIVIGNALRLDWGGIVPKDELTCILGNPPYLGKDQQSEIQKEDMKIVCVGKIKNYASLDFVSGWFVKAAEFIVGTEIKVGFVSTNSLTQGEQVPILWDYLLNKLKISINFAHRTFKWFNHATGQAQVHVVIIGFAAFEPKSRMIFDYETPSSDPIEQKANNINAYLLNQANILIYGRSKPLCNVPEVVNGSKPTDNENFLFSEQEKDEFIRKEPGAIKYMRPFVGAREFLHGEKKWCLWLKDIQPSEIKLMPRVEERIQRVKEFRLNSIDKQTRKDAAISYLFQKIRQPCCGDLIILPLVTSEKRKYIPMVIFPSDNIIGNRCSFIPNAGLYHFGVITSAMHMAWMKQLCGRMKSDYSYSNKIVYNTFPWADNPTEKEVQNVEACAQAVLDVRKSDKYKNSSLADQYDNMLIELSNAHKKLDTAVDRCYRPKPFNTDAERMEFLFGLYKEYIDREKVTVVTISKPP